jgi:hypothetical protein
MTPDHRRTAGGGSLVPGMVSWVAEDIMPLRDHFRPPLKDFPAFSSVHSMWASQIVERFNLQVLSGEYVSHAEIKLGPLIEIDVATFEADPSHGKMWTADSNGEGGVALASEQKTFSPPVPALSARIAVFDPDSFEIKIYRDGGSWNLVAAIELVSESNKDRPEHRRAFANKVAGYVQRGVSAVVVDTVTNRNANLHSELSEVMAWPADLDWESATGISAVSYRTVRAGETVRLDAWPHELTVGAP